MNKLSQYVGGRDNNYNLIRFIAAFMVLFAHSFPLSTGDEHLTPNIQTLTLGRIAVDLFFITSGFLITASLLGRKQLLQFLQARVLRIYPALIVSSFVTVFVVGVVFTQLSVSNYLNDSGTYAYLLKNSSLVFGLHPHLPGVFADVPYENAVNGSLWTLPWEVRMYGLLFLLWVVLSRVGHQFFVFFVVLVAIGSLLVMLTDHFIPFVDERRWMITSRLVAMFFMGSAFFLLRDRILVSGKLFFLACSLLLASAFYQGAFYVVYHLLVAYLVVCFAYIPSGVIRKFNSFGDYSYGLYIFAFPVQQSVMMVHKGAGPWSLFLYSSVITLILALLSWHFVEKKALKLKNYSFKFRKLEQQDASAP